MLDVLKKTLSPLASLFIFALCSGFFNTLITLSMHQHDERSVLIGAINGIFYAGLVCGAYRIEPFIMRVGHIRAFSTFASALAVMSLLHGMFYNMPLWFVLRFFTGFGTAGIFVVIESWLLASSTDATRGRILSLYMIVFYASEAFGQLLINIAEPSKLLLYAIAAMLCSLSVIPVSITHIKMPEFSEPSTMKLSALCKETMSSFFGCIFAGMILSAAYALFPVVFSEYYHNSYQVSVMMFCLILGGMLLQYPVGKLSDTFDRRLVVIMVCLVSIAASVALLFTIRTNYHLSMPIITVLGGLSTTIYPICISYACDKLSPKDIVAGIRGLLLAYSIGAAGGPLLASLFMHGTDERYLMLYFIAAFGCTGILFIWRRKQKESLPQEEPFQMMRQTTPVLAKIDPRGE